MLAPTHPTNERERQLALESFSVLDTANEAAFDGVTRLAAHILDVPIALISLVDRDRQWFKSRVGLEATELSRDLSFCGHVVQNDVPMVVHDALRDLRFADNPLVTGDPVVRFYAGMPLRTEDGYVLGTLCAIDHQPRDVSPAQMEMLELLAKQVIHLMNKRKLRLETQVVNSSLAAQKERLEAIIDVMAEGLVVQNGVGEITLNNAAATRILALSDEQMRGRSSVDPRWRSVRDDGSDFPGDQHPAMHVLRTGERVTNTIMGVHTPEGELTWISINSQPSRVVDGVVEEVVTTFHDVTLMRRAAERMAQQQRLATTGTLVAGVGHEINNPLAFVMGNLDLAVEEIRAIAGPSPSARLQELSDILAEARVGADRIRKIVRGLRALSREDVALQPVELEAAVETSMSMAQHELRRKATVTTDVAGLPRVMGDESRLTQVLVNLLVNAGQAFEEADPDRNRVVVRGSVLPGNRVRVTISDNGPGIAAENLTRIFDAFFTTKDVGKGTGLGLAVSRSITAAMGGELTVESRPGAGAAFHIELALADADTDADAGSIDTAATRGRVLLLDDDVSVLATMRRLMAREHNVTALSDPRRALELLLTGADVDVIFCDLMMPHMTGHELFAAVAASRPELASRFVFVTGGATTSEAVAFLEGLPNEVVEKPFSLPDLLVIARRFVAERLST
jgi:two-component system, NtrC family, sensor kinase